MLHIGIDLSKTYFDATLRKSAESKIHQQFANTPAGFAALAGWLRTEQVSAAQVCMEATNIYWEGLADFLYQQGFTVSVVNPARIKGFAMSQLRRTKTDKLDSEVIADFCAVMQPKAWTPPTPAQRKLRSLVRHRTALHKTLTQQKNRLADATDAEVTASLQRLIDYLAQELKQVDTAINAFFPQHPALQEQRALLQSIPGIGPVASATFLAEMYDLASYTDAHAAAADAGLAPAHHESGATVRRKPMLSKVGKASIRAILHFPALTAMRHNPLIQQFVLRLKQRHKPDFLIRVAVMRKLVHLAYGVLKNKTPFDPNWGTIPTLAT